MAASLVRRPRRQPPPAPAHQMKQYYVYGEIDPCEIEWDDLMLCLKTKLKKPEESEVRRLSRP